MPQPVPAHIPTAAEVDCHLVEKINADGTCIVLDRNTGQLTTCRLGILLVANQLTLVAVGPGSS
jgi:hypothetical protein